jgi:hypothetical protein
MHCTNGLGDPQDRLRLYPRMRYCAAVDAAYPACYTFAAMRAMRGYRRLYVLALILAASAFLPAQTWAQDPGVAVITSPLEGATLTGLVPITGSATHPQFQRYELAFGYSPNPTDTWFSLQAPATSQVVNEVLGRWDTTQITDGLYVLRLRVFYGENAYLETFVANVRVQNATPTPVILPPATDTAVPAATATAGPTSTAPVIALPPTATARATTVTGGAPVGDPPASGAPIRINAGLIGAAFLAGVRLTFVAFLLLAAYVSLKAVLRFRR